KSHCTDTVRPLLDGLFGETRSLYKRLAQFSALDDPETYDLLARRPYEWLVECGGRLADQLSRSAGIYIPAEHVLLDAPPSKLEVQFDIDVYYPKEDCYRTLGDVSPVVRTLAEIQFDRIVKRVRVYVHPSAKEQLPANLDVAAMVREVASS
ncbi:MAG: metal-dependent phosphohydrolase, partial [Planctomycetales bacterium]|nr:metal-dependent phosphohydrolase [Planctomycetales bacterium]